MVNALSFSAFIIILIPSSSATLVSRLSDLIYVSNFSSSITNGTYSCIFNSLSAETKKLLKLVLLFNDVVVQFKILMDNVDAADNELKLLNVVFDVVIKLSIFNIDNFCC